MLKNHLIVSSQSIVFVLFEFFYNVQHSCPLVARLEEGVRGDRGWVMGSKLGHCTCTVSYKGIRLRSEKLIGAVEKFRSFQTSLRNRSQIALLDDQFVLNYSHRVMLSVGH
ncbi:hypothetical protein Dimus_021337 [Dionaea muscipula]